MAGEYHLEGLAVPESLDRLHDLMHRVREEHAEVDETMLMLFETAIIEIHGNVVQHGRPQGQVLYTFDLDVREDRLVGLLADNGEALPDLSQQSGLLGADPAGDAGEDPGAELGDEVSEDAESGRGMRLARAALDEMDYARRNDQNTWRMVKQRT